MLSNVILVPALISTLLLVDSKVAIGGAVTLGGSYTAVYHVRRRSLRRNSQIISLSGQQRIKIVQEGIGGIRDVLLGRSQDFFERAFLRAEMMLKQAQATNSIISVSPTYLLKRLHFLLLLS